MDEATAYLAFCDLRWPHAVTCPSCAGGGVGLVETRGLFRCKVCRRQFSATTGTPLASLKLPFATLMRAVELRRAGTNRHRAAKELGVQYRTTHALWAKLDAIGA
jgi:transposase-like protein